MPAPKQARDPNNIPVPDDRKMEQLVTACVFLLVFPLVPLLFEWVFQGDVKPDSVPLGAAMYALGLGVASNNRRYFSLCIFAGFCAAVAYGRATLSQGVSPLWG